MARFKVQWDGCIFATSIVTAETKEEAIQKVEQGEAFMDHIDEINDICVADCEELKE